jgi:hypothetical protein
MDLQRAKCRFKAGGELENAFDRGEPLEQFDPAEGYWPGFSEG